MTIFSKLAKGTEQLAESLSAKLNESWEKYRNKSPKDIYIEVKKKVEQDLNEIKNSDAPEDIRVGKIITYTAATCGALAMANPLPLSDFFVLTPIQCVMVANIGKIKGFELSMERSKEIIFEMLTTVGWGLLAQHMIVSAYKTFLPFLGGALSFPLVYGFTYAIGQISDYYFDNKRSGKEIDKKVFQEIWKQLYKQGVDKGKEVDKK